MNIVLVHGFSFVDVEPEVWKRVVFGSVVVDKIGRATAGLLAAIEMKILYGQVLLLFGAGIPTDEQGRHESEIEKAFIEKHPGKIPQFSAFKRLGDVSRRFFDANVILTSFSRCDFASENSYDSTRWAVSCFGGVPLCGHRLVIASDPNHLPRCLNDASGILYQEGLRGVVSSGFESAFPYTGKPGDCVVVEPSMKAVIADELDELLALGKKRMRDAGANPAKHYQDVKYS